MKRLADANADVLEVLVRDPLQLFAHGEAMMLAAHRSDTAGVQAWIDAAYEVYPRRADLIEAFAGRAWASMGDLERSLQAFESRKLGGPFVTDAFRESIETSIATLERRLAARESIGAH